MTIIDINNFHAAIESSLSDFISVYAKNPHHFFTENDLVMALNTSLKNHLPFVTSKDRNGHDVHLIHGEYPTPFRCDMSEHAFRLATDDEITPRKGKFKRGHYDCVIINPNVTPFFSYHELRSQDYRILHQQVLPIIKNSGPLILYGVELNFFRNPLRSEYSIEKAAKLVLQDHHKLLASKQVPGFMNNVKSIVFIGPDDDVKNEKFQEMLIDKFNFYLKEYSDIVDVSPNNQ